ncbi:MAG: BamA/TamA family outer membrane protein [Deltaproteobacteria bacterium]|nr:BamA/TamA family outer membrane protein [Deltaproteobacteria bacterium]
MASSSRSLTFLLSSLVLAACASKKPPPRRAGEEFISTIEVEGNTTIKDNTLVKGTALHRRQHRGLGPDPYLLQVDADRIRGDYLRKGYLGVDVRPRFERKGEATKVIYTVDEGKRATTRVVITGLPKDVPASAIREVLPIVDGAPFDYAVYEKAKPFLITVVKDAGYARAKLESEVLADRANGEAIVSLAYDPGPKCRFGKIEITGVDGALADAVRGRLAFATGDQYSTTAITTSQRQLYGFQRFSTVQVQPDDGVSDVVDVKVAVSEAARREVKLGGGFGIDPTAYEIRGRAGYSIAGFPTDLDTLTLEFRPAYAYARDRSGWEPRIRALSRVERQDIFWTYSKGLVEAGYNYLAIEAYTSLGPRAALGFSTPIIASHFGQRVQLRLGWGIEQLRFKNISPLIDPALQMELGLDHRQRVGTYQQALTVDLRDNPMNTKRGLFAEMRVAEGTPYAGSEYDYIQVIPELRGFLPLGGTVLAARARAGTFIGDVPVTERFFSGGASNHRGFGERDLSPSVSGEVMGSETTVPYGGETLFETGIEARIPLTTWRKMGVGTVVFLDGGDVVEERRDLDFANLHWAAGLGLRLLTVVGPIRADLGYRLNRFGPTEPAPGSRFAFHFSIGEAF